MKKQKIHIAGLTPEEFANLRTLQDSRWLALRLGISYEKARQLGRRMEVPCLRIGKLLRYSPEAIDQFLKSKMIQPVEPND
jgi:hypothetical protein